MNQCHFTKQNENVRMNKWKQLQKMPVNITRYYQPKKSNIISKKDFKDLITKCFDSNDPEDPQAIITIHLMYCGLLCQNEVHKIEVKDVKVCETSKNIFIDFGKSTKWSARGFGFMSPAFMYAFFKSYIAKLLPTKENAPNFKESPFLKNWNKRSRRYIQNMGIKKHNTILRRIEVFLKLPSNSLTAHVWRRSAATELANSGISLLGLKRADRWKKLASAEEYLGHSLPVQKDRVDRLFDSEGVLEQNINIVGDQFEMAVSEIP